jgi:hypothetical protein
MNSDLRLNARFQDQNQTIWSEFEITAKGRELFAFAKNIWPFT